MRMLALKDLVNGLIYSSIMFKEVYYWSWEHQAIQRLVGAGGTPLWKKN